MAAMLSQITTCLSPEAMLSILDGVALDAAAIRQRVMTLPWLKVTMA